MDSQTKDLVRQAGAAYRAGQFDDAAELYRQAHAIDPESPLILEQLGALALLGNQADEAVAYLEQAARNVSWPASLWPLDAQRKTRLAMAYYRQDRFADASRLFRQASGPIPVGPFRDLRTLADHTALFADRQPYRVEGPEQSRVPFVVTDPLPVLPVSVNGQEPAYFILDTGGAEVILDDGLAEEAGAEMAGAFSGTYGGDRKAQTGVGRVEAIRLGEITLTDVPIHTLDLDSVSSMYDGLEIRGVIGTRLLMRFLATIDYPKGELLLRRPSAENHQALERRLAESGGVQFPFWLADLHYMLAQGQVNDSEPMLFFVDTGLAGNAFSASEKTLEELGIEIDWTKAELGPGGGGMVKSAGFVVDRLALGSGTQQVVETGLPGVAIEGSVPVLGDALGFHVGGMISHAFFRHHALTLDFESMRLVIE